MYHNTQFYHHICTTFPRFFSTFPSISLNLPEVGASEGDKAAVASAALEDRLRDALHRRRHRHEADSWM